MTHLLAKLSRRQQQQKNHSHHHHGHVDTTLKQKHDDLDDTEPVASLPCCSTNPAADLERMQKMAHEIDTFQQTEQHEWDADAAHKKEHKQGSCCDYGTCSRPETDEELDDEEDLDEEQSPAVLARQDSAAHAETEKHQREKHEHNMELLKTGINTAIAIGTVDGCMSQIILGNGYNSQVFFVSSSNSVAQLPRRLGYLCRFVVGPQSRWCLGSGHCDSQHSNGTLCGTAHLLRNGS